MSWITHVEELLKTHGAALHGIEAIANLVRDALTDSTKDTGAVLAAVEKIAETLIAGWTGKLKAEDVLAEVQKTAASLTSNNSLIDSEIDERFDGEGNG